MMQIKSTALYRQIWHKFVMCIRQYPFKKLSSKLSWFCDSHFQFFLTSTVTLRYNLLSFRSRSWLYLELEGWMILAVPPFRLVDHHLSLRFSRRSLKQTRKIWCLVQRKLRQMCRWSLSMRSLRYDANDGFYSSVAGWLRVKTITFCWRCASLTLYSVQPKGGLNHVW